MEVFAFTEDLSENAISIIYFEETAAVKWLIEVHSDALWMITRAVLRLECSLDCLSAPTYRYIAPRMIQRIILKFCGYVGCDDATNVSNFGYEPIKFNQLNQ